MVITLHSFSGSPGDGAVPVGGLVQGSDGNFYGTTVLGGANRRGTLFSIDATGNFTTLHSFSGSPSEGALSFAGLVQGNDGNLYGTTALGERMAPAPCSPSEALRARAPRLFRLA